MSTPSNAGSQAGLIRNLTSFECHEISRLHAHLVRATSGSFALSPAKHYTAAETLASLRDRVSHLPTLCIRPVTDLDLHVFSLVAFSSLRELTLDKIPPSTIEDFYSLRSNLVKLVIVNSGIPDLAKAIAPIKQKYLRGFKPMLLSGESPKVRTTHQWTSLTHLTLSNCGITKMDSSLHLLPNLEVLDISHNDISHIIHLQDCIHLRVVNVAYNRVSVLSNVGWVIGNVQVFNVSHNTIQSLDGIERLHSLRKLDLSYNMLSDINEIKGTVALRDLKALSLVGNPSAMSQNYRLYIFSLFLQECSVDGRRLPALDGQFITGRESHTIKASIFLPPEVAINAGGHPEQGDKKRSACRQGILIGGTMVYNDDIPIHELDKLFQSENERYNGEVENAKTSGRSPRTDIASTTPAALGGLHADRAARPLPLRVVSGGETSFRVKIRMLHVKKRQRYRRVAVITDHDENTMAIDINTTVSAMEALGVDTPVRRSSFGRDSSSRLSLSNSSRSLEGDGDLADNRLASSSPMRLSRSSPTRTATPFSSAPSSPGKSCAAVIIDEERIQSVCPSVDKDDSISQERELRAKRKSDLLMKLAKHHSVIEKTLSVDPEVRQTASADSIDSAEFEVAVQGPLNAEEEGATACTPTISPEASRIPEERLVTAHIDEGKEESVSLVVQSSDTHVVDVRAEIENLVGMAEVVESTVAREARGEKWTSGGESVWDGGGAAAGVSMGDEDLAKGDAHQRVETIAAHGMLEMDDGSGSDDNIDAVATHVTQALPDAAATVESEEYISAETNSSAHDSAMKENVYMERPSAVDEGPDPESLPLVRNGLSSVPSRESCDVAAEGFQKEDTFETSSPTRRSGVSVKKHSSRWRKPVPAPKETSTLPRKAPSGTLESSSSSQVSSTASSVVDSFRANSSSVSSRDGTAQHMSNPALTRLASMDGTEISSMYSGDDPIGFPVGAGMYINPSAMASQDEIAEAERFAMMSSRHGMKSPVPSYTGAIDFEHLSVSDNLEQYFKEQVFGHNRPSGLAPYMRHEVTISPSRGNSTPRDESDVYVEPPSKPERIVSFFREKVLEVQCADSRFSATRGPEQDADALHSRVFILTDLNLYVVLDNFSSVHMFADAPLPVLHRRHCIETLRSCTLYFGFQRCALEFCDEDMDFLSRNRLKGPDSSTTYMIVTRDKAHTHPIITAVPQMANVIRLKIEPPLKKVKMVNKDSQLLDAVADIVHSLGGVETDVVHYQMLYQIWKQKPGFALPRTLILTPVYFLLCDEDTSQIDVRISVIDCVKISDIHKVRPEDDPLKLSLIMKPSGSMSFTKRKWRLQADSSIMMSRVLDEMRKAFADAEITHL